VARFAEKPTPHFSHQAYLYQLIVAGWANFRQRALDRAIAWINTRTGQNCAEVAKLIKTPPEQRRYLASGVFPPKILQPGTTNVPSRDLGLLPFMNIDLSLDYQTILRNEPRPVHLVATLCAPKLEAHTRPRSAAFAVVLERSGSVAGGEPLRLGARGADFKFCAKSTRA
jgi:hypothetical protein